MKVNTESPARDALVALVALLVLAAVAIALVFLVAALLALAVEVAAAGWDAGRNLGSADG